MEIKYYKDNVVKPFSDYDLASWAGFADVERNAVVYQ